MYRKSKNFYLFSFTFFLWLETVCCLRGLLNGELQLCLFLLNLLHSEFSRYYCKLEWLFQHLIIFAHKKKNAQLNSFNLHISPLQTLIFCTTIDVWQTHQLSCLFFFSLYQTKCGSYEVKVIIFFKNWDTTKYSFYVLFYVLWIFKSKKSADL